MFDANRPNWNSKRVTIKDASRPGEVYWVGMFDDAEIPEFTAYHPAVIIRGCLDVSEKRSTVSFVPITSTPPQEPLKPYIYKLSRNPHPTDTRDVWAVCDHIYTVRLHRLERYYDQTKGKLVVARLDKGDMNGVVAAVRLGYMAIEERIRADVKSQLAVKEAQISEQLSKRFDEELVARLDEEFHRRVAIEVARLVEVELDRLTRPIESI